MMGIIPGLPRASLTERSASFSRVPLTLACEKRSVMPTSVRKRLVGKPATISVTFIPPKNKPTMSAKAMEDRR